MKTKAFTDGGSLLNTWHAGGSKIPCSSSGCRGDMSKLGRPGGHSSDCEFGRQDGRDALTHSLDAVHCALCDEQIPAGALIRFDDYGRPCHPYGCPEVVVIATAPNGVCPLCWLARAVNGSCGCDE